MQPAKSALALTALSLALASTPYAAPEKGGPDQAMHGPVEPDGDRDDMGCGCRHGEKSRSHEGYADRVLMQADKLKLSDEQMGKIIRIHMQDRQKLRELFGKLRDTMKSAYDAFLDPSADEATIRKDAMEHTKIFDQMVDTSLKDREAVNKVLTPDQLKQLKSLKGEH
jgi:Spy/CpxP family protein refolding chaperone